MSTRLRIDIKGLVAIDLGKYDPATLNASHLVAVFLSPELVGHHPRLIVPKNHVDTASTTMPYSTDGDRLIFDISNYNLDVQVSHARATGIALPPGLTADPDGRGLLGPISYIPSLAQIAGHATLDKPYAWPSPTTDVVAACRITSGEALAHLPQNGPPPRWTFFDGSATPDNAPWRLDMNASSTVVCQMHDVTSASIVATPRQAGVPLLIAFVLGPRILMELIHDCDEGCDETIGKEFPRFYQMLEKRHRTPQSAQQAMTDTGWCPPGLFWS